MLMDIHFRKDRLLNSCCIYKSAIECSGLNVDNFFVRRPEFKVTWDAINRNTEEMFRVFPALSEQHTRHTIQSSKERHHVVCVVAYLQDHDYFYDAITSILQQTRKPDSIVIGIDNAHQDDASQDLRLASRALESAGIHVSTELFTGLNGPYHIFNCIIGKMHDTALLWLHDSDDISHPTRLEKQISFMDYHQLDICGSFELRFDQAGYELFQYPINVSRALLIEPGHCMLWPSSLIKASLWRKLGGCSDAYRFGADTEFQLRACFIARMGNLPSFLYARRRRSNSLTTSINTGLRSWTRGYINSIYKAEYYQRQIIRSSGNVPVLTPRFSLASDRSSGERFVEGLTDNSAKNYKQTYSPHGSSV
jgi:hypothetical protein